MSIEMELVDYSGKIKHPDIDTVYEIFQQLKPWDVRSILLDGIPYNREEVNRKWQDLKMLPSHTHSKPATP